MSSLPFILKMLLGNWSRVLLITCLDLEALNLASLWPLQTPLYRKIMHGIQVNFFESNSKIMPVNLAVISSELSKFQTIYFKKIDIWISWMFSQIKEESWLNLEMLRLVEDSIVTKERLLADQSSFHRRVKNKDFIKPWESWKRLRLCY